MGEFNAVIIAILAVLLSVVAIISGVVINPINVEEDAITDRELANNCVTTAEIMDGTIVSTDLNSEVLATLTRMFQVNDDSVSSGKIVDDSITIDDIGDDAVGSAEIIDWSVDTDDIVNGSITSSKLSSSALMWNNINGMPMEVLAAGYIKSDGEVEYGYNVINASYNVNTTFYTVNMTGYNSSHNYITLITFSLGASAYENIAHAATALNVWLYDKDGNHVQDDFYFVTYKLN